MGLVFAAIGVAMALRPSIRSSVPGMPRNRAEETPPWFEEVAAQRGIDFRHVSRFGMEDSDAPLHFPEIMTGGVGVLDFNRDGYFDVYFVQGGRILGSRGGVPGNRLYLNVDGRSFEDVTERAGVGDTGYGMGCAVGDFDGDGWPDLYVTNVGANVLYRNNHDGTFTDVTDSAHVGDTGFGASAAFLDFDRDGDLDLFVVNYIRWSAALEQDCRTPADRPDYCGPLNYKAPAPDTLYRNEGDGTFTDVSQSAGIAERFGNGLGVLPADFDGDGWTDLYVANDKSANQLWINQRDGTFRDVGLERGLAYNGQGLAEAGMGVDARDFDGDGDLDLLVTNFARETNTLYENRGALFEDVTIQSGLAGSKPFTGFGIGMVDFNRDGVLDLYVANGRVVAGPFVPPATDVYAEPNQLFKGLGDSRYREIAPRGGTNPPLVHSSRAAAFCDYDNDGDVDIFVANRDGPAYLLENRAPGDNHWIAFRVTNPNGGDAIGARIQIEAEGRTQTRDVRTAFSYCASNDPRVYFGLGTAAKADRVIVTWPDGQMQTFLGLQGDQLVELPHPNQSPQ